jgi:hypothetical protein
LKTLLLTRANPDQAEQQVNFTIPAARLILSAKKPHMILVTGGSFINAQLKTNICN